MLEFEGNDQAFNVTESAQTIAQINRDCSFTVYEAQIPSRFFRRNRCHLDSQLIPLHGITNEEVSVKSIRSL